MRPDSTTSTRDWTAVDLLERFGPIRLDRIRMVPEPGTATERDVVDVNERKQGLCELVDGVLVEKTTGMHEAYLAASLVALLGVFVRRNGAGIVLGADGATRLAAGLVRLPDAAYYAAASLPKGGLPRLPMMPVSPTLAIEVISQDNTRQEMDRKLREYFEFGAAEVWHVHPAEYEFHRFLDVEQREVYRPGDHLKTPQLLPGFEVDVEDFFRSPILQ